MKKLIILTTLCFILLSGLATSESYTFQKDAGVNFPFVCLTENNSYCTSSTYCTITTTISKTGTKLLDNETMTWNETYFNISLPTNTSGTYSNIIVCSSSNATSSEFTYSVNPTGIEPSESRTQSLTRSIYIFFLVGILLFIAFLFTKQSTPVKWTLFIFGVIFFLIAINIVSVTVADEVVNPNLESFFDGFAAISWIFYWFAGMLLIVMWMFTFIQTYLMRKAYQNAERFGSPI